MIQNRSFNIELIKTLTVGMHHVQCHFFFLHNVTSSHHNKFLLLLLLCSYIQKHHMWSGCMNINITMNAVMIKIMFFTSILNYFPPAAVVVILP